MLTTTGRIARPSSLADILDKGMVIDAFVRVSLVGIELLTIDARIVIASVDTYLRFAEAVDRLDLQPEGQPRTLPTAVKQLKESGTGAKVHGVLRGVRHAASEIVDTVRGRRGQRGHEDQEEQEEG
jgi:hypothetical protein